MRSKQLRT